MENRIVIFVLALVTGSMSGLAPKVLDFHIYYRGGSEGVASGINGRYTVRFEAWKSNNGDEALIEEVTETQHIFVHSTQTGQRSLLISVYKKGRALG